MAPSIDSGSYLSRRASEENKRKHVHRRREPSGLAAQYGSGRWVGGKSSSGRKTLARLPVEW